MRSVQKERYAYVKVLVFFFFLQVNICCGTHLEARRNKNNCLPDIPSYLDQSQRANNVENVDLTS